MFKYEIGPSDKYTFEIWSIYSVYIFGTMYMGGGGRRFNIQNTSIWPMAYHSVDIRTELKTKNLTISL